ncbi:MAG: cell division protein FtsW [Alphaproteobacteria bacterium]|nr:cell division protein FtsW [Alphaproteobacteria bacterium]
MSFSRANRSELSDWWWTVDRVSLAAMLALLGIGLMLAVAASPAASGGPLTGGNFHYAAKQVGFAALAVFILCSTSMLTPAKVGRVALTIYIVALIASVVVLFAGTETLGARRWLDLGWITLQPSEFLKPGFAVIAAVILADRTPTRLSKHLITFIVLLPALTVLLLEPDVGQTFLILALWAAMLFFAGLALKWIWVIGGWSAGLGALAYLLFPHVHHRIAQFLDPEQAGYQASLSLKAFAHGGLLGVGPGAGTIKYRLPDAHSDFIFAVAGEEFGLALCAIIALLFCVLAVRLLLRSAAAREPFAQLAGAGLSIVFAVQAFINMGVAVNLLPAKGMTLPFISYGGSSLFAVAVTMGFALAFTRQRPQLVSRDAPSFGFLKWARA